MSKLDELRRTSVGNIDESMGGGRTIRPSIHGVSAPGPRAVPSKLQGITRSGNAAEIPVDKIGAEDQPREEFDEAAIDRLAESLRTKGQLQPIRVRWSEERGLYLIICGERRWRAAMKAGLATLSCVISEGPIPPAELLALQVIENMLREDLSDVEQAKAFRTLMESNGWSTHQLAKELGIVQPRVVRAMALLKLPDEVQEQVEQGALKASVAYELSKLDNAVEQVEVAARVVSEGLSRDEIVEVVRKASSKPGRAGASKAKGKGATPKPLPTERTIKTSSGIKVIAQARKGFDVLAWVEALEDALQQARAKVDESSPETAGRRAG
jgi:ParB family transcriptional regulator, chromosome partitioning protein